jgi:hypothetical protein
MTLLALAASLAVLATVVLGVWFVGIGINETLPQIRELAQCNPLVPFANCA